MNVIVDYGMGNLRSIQSKIRMLDLDAEISDDPKVLERASRFILPGVGNFGAAMGNIFNLGVYDVLRDKVMFGKTPILGICLGMQLLGKHSEEGDVEGLGFLDFRVRQFQFADSRLRIPHVGWNDLTQIRANSVLLSDIPADVTYYFTHSFYAETMQSDIVAARTDYGCQFVSVVESGNVFGTQFHPEKSRQSGLLLLKNFFERT